MRLFRFALALIAAGSALAADDRLLPLFAKMDKVATTFKGLTADVKKVAHTAVLNEDAVQTGTFALKKPKPREFKMLLSLRPPDEQRVLVTNSRVEIYYPKTNTVKGDDMNKQYRPLAELFLLLGFGNTSQDLQSNYTVTLGGLETVGGQATTRIELIPVSKEVAQLKRIELWISNATGLAVQQKFWEAGGNYNLAAYTNVIVRDVPDPAVALNLPRNVVREHLTR